MGCLYSDSDGNCTLTFGDDGEFVAGTDQEGSEDGICVIDGDPEPADSCGNYSSDWECKDCGVDLNVGECSCPTL